MRYVIAVGLVVLGVGCGSSQRGREPAEVATPKAAEKKGPVAKYDAVHDYTEVQGTVRKVELEGRNDVSAHLFVGLRGNGKHPTEWKADLSVVARQPRDAPDVLSEHPTLVFGPTAFPHSFKAY